MDSLKDRSSIGKEIEQIVAERGHPMTLDDYLKEVYVCNTPNCPHPLHTMTIEEYKQALIKKAEATR